MQIVAKAVPKSTDYFQANLSTKTFEPSTQFSAKLIEMQESNLYSPEIKDKSAEGVTMHTSKGNIELDLDDYLTPTPGKKSLLDIPLLLPTEHNVNTLAKYTQHKVQSLLEQYGIPEYPATMEFDQEGRLVLPANYQHSAELKKALDENPLVLNALSTTAALASHYAGIMERQPFRDEMATARSNADRKRIVEKYSYLFDKNRPKKQVVLQFLDDGSMLIGQK
ncbi:hypothetical protein [Thalassotalea ganghwensis]